MWKPNIKFVNSYKYVDVEHAICAAIETGELLPLDKLPPVRELAWHLSITPGTVARAYSNLKGQGLLIAQTGKGTFVAQRDRTPQDMVQYDGPQEMKPSIEQPPDGAMLLSNVVPPDFGQSDLIRKSLQKIGLSLTQRQLIQYPKKSDKVALYEALYDQIIKHMNIGPVEPSDILLTHGAQSADFLIIELLVRGCEASVAVDSQHYMGFQKAAIALGRQIVAIEWDDEGPMISALKNAALHHGLKLYATCADANVPTARAISIRRRKEICELAREHDFHILDDYCYMSQSASLEGFRVFAPERSWVVGTVSKMFSSALRLGWCIPPRDHFETFRTITNTANNFGVSPMHANLLQEILTDPHFPTIRKKVHDFSRKRVLEMAKRFEKYCDYYNSDLPFIWITLPDRWSCAVFSKEAAFKGVRIRAADEFSLAGTKCENAIRLGVNGAMNDDQWHQALDILYTLIESAPPEHDPV